MEKTTHPTTKPPIYAMPYTLEASDVAAIAEAITLAGRNTVGHLHTVQCEVMINGYYSPAAKVELTRQLQRLADNAMRAAVRQADQLIQEHAERTSRPLG